MEDEIYEIKDEIYEQELFKKVENIQYALNYYINRTKELEFENKILKEAYENRINEYLKLKLNCDNKHYFIEDGHSEKCLDYGIEESDELCNYCKMTKEQEEAIELLRRIDITYFLNGNIEQPNYMVNRANETNNAIETVLNMLKEKDKEIEKLKQDFKIVDEECSRLEKKDIEKDKEIEKKDKIINLMAKAFKQDDVRTVEEIKQYFENKVNSTEQ